MDVGVSKFRLYSLSITISDSCIQWQLSSEGPENLGQLKVLFEVVNMSVVFLWTTYGSPLVFFFWWIFDKFNKVSLNTQGKITNLSDLKSYVTTS